MLHARRSRVVRPSSEVTQIGSVCAPRGSFIVARMRTTHLLAGALFAVLPLASVSGCSASPSDGETVAQGDQGILGHLCPEYIIYCPPDEVRTCRIENGCSYCTCSAPTPPAPQTLATGNYPTGVATDGTNVYWLADTEWNLSDDTGSWILSTCPVSGCNGAPKTLASGGGQQSENVAVDGSNVYWTAGSNLYSCAKTGCAAPTLLHAGQSPAELALDASNIYWTDSGSLLKCAKTGCGSAPVTVGSSDGAALAVDSSGVYWFQSKNLVTCPSTGCNGAPVTLATNVPEGSAFTIDATNVYWVVGTWTNYSDLGSVSGPSYVEACAKTGCTAAGPRTLVTTADSDGYFTGITVDASNVYWTAVTLTLVGSPATDAAMTGSVKSCPIAGCTTPTTIWSEPIGTLNTVGLPPGPFNIVNESSTLIWTNWQGAGGTIDFGTSNATYPFGSVMTISTQ